MPGEGENTPQPPAISQGGEGGGIFTDPKKVRSDAQMVAHMLSCGVIEQEQAEGLLRTAFILAADAAREKKTREFVSLMKIPLAAARLPQTARPAVAIQNNIGVQQDDRAIDRKREVEVERAEFELELAKANYVHRDEVTRVFDVLGVQLAQAMSEIAKISTPAQAVLSRHLQMAQDQIHEIWPDS